MKPVNLLPGDAAVVSTAPAGKPNYGMIGGALLGVIAVVGVAGYFAMARVDSVKSETAKFQADASAATSETTAVRNQISSLGQPVVDSDKQLAQGKEEVLVAAYTERHDFPLLARELRDIMDPKQGWYTKITAKAATDGGEKSVVVEGYLASESLLASFNERAEGTRSLKDASTTSVASERLTNLSTKKVGTYWKFTLEADLVDLETPSVSGADGSADGNTTVAAGGDGAITLSLSSEPPKAVVKPKPKPAAQAEPKNPFDVAAAAAARGGGS